MSELAAAQSRMAARREAILRDPGFGNHFGPHMFVAEWDSRGGWDEGRIMPYGPVTLEPASAVFQNAQSVFEGLKAYRWADESIWLFRPEVNDARFAKSCDRLAIPRLGDDALVDSIRRLIQFDHEWVPAASEGKALYLRPMVFSTEKHLQVRSSTHFRFVLYSSPVGSYFVPGAAINLWLSTEFTRAGPGGTGFAKTPANYASSMAAHTEAFANGCDQVLFVDAVGRDRVEELGGMNVFLVLADGTLVTPPTGGTVLAGVTRDSVKQIATALGHRVIERVVTISDWRDGIETGRVAEVFATGTAAGIAPIGSVKWERGLIPAPARHDVTLTLREHLVGIQHGQLRDERGWMRQVG